MYIYFICIHALLFIGHKNVRVVCTMQKLLQLVGKSCHSENCNSSLEVTYKICGFVATVQGSCVDGHSFNWVSSDVIVNQNGSKVMEENLNLTAARVLSGNQFSKISLILQFAGLAVISSSSFHAYQRLYICPAVNNYFLKEQVHTYVDIHVAFFNNFSHL